jgi:hypothetical protein
MPTDNTRGTDIDRWSSWRRGTTVSVTPPDTSLFRVTTCDGESVIGLTPSQQAALGTTPMGGHSNTDLLRRLDGVGYLTVYEYNLTERAPGDWVAKPARQAPLFARNTIRIEHFDPEAELEGLAIAA